MWTSIASQACVDAVSVDVAQKSPRSNRQCPNDKSVVFGRCVFTSNAVIPLPYFVCACVLKTTSDPVWCKCHACCVNDHGSGVRFSCSAARSKPNLREDHGKSLREMTLPQFSCLCARDWVCLVSILTMPTPPQHFHPGPQLCKVWSEIVLT